MLLVSDIHAGNQYDLMRTIVQEEGVDVVVDAGDLVNFGTVEEAEATGLFTGIESVGVPYLFVRGNHDANSADRHRPARPPRADPERHAARGRQPATTPR